MQQIFQYSDMPANYTKDSEIRTEKGCFLSETIKLADSCLVSLQSMATPSPQQSTLVTMVTFTLSAVHW